MFKTIVVAVDGSSQSDHAVFTACDIAKKYNSKIHLVHSPEIDTFALAVGSGAFAMEPSQEQIEEAGKSIMDKAIGEAKNQGCEVEKSHLANGDPAQIVLDYAKKVNADLIVAGRRGLGNLSAIILGSVSQTISHHAQCACLTVK